LLFPPLFFLVINTRIFARTLYAATIRVPGQ
jgi:hypothetical protein